MTFLLSKGGFFLNCEDHFKGDLYKFSLNKENIVRFYFEGLATRHDSITSKFMPGYPRYVFLREACQYQGFDSDRVEQEYPSKFITYKPALHTRSWPDYKETKPFVTLTIGD
ncbi:MAG: hypothetical protein OWQ49_01225 [Aquificaceae bacterium]|nr:hypothetical protein [Aquificaceae bacterium]